MSPRRARLLLFKRDLNVSFSCRLCGAPYDSRLEACPECGRPRNLCSYLSIPSELGRVRNRGSKAAAATSWSLSLMALSMVALAVVKLAQASSARPLSSARPSISANVSVVAASTIAAPEPIHRVADRHHKSRGWPRFSQHARLRAASSMAARQLRESGAIVGAGGGL
jgi:hypothetical protein